MKRMVMIVVVAALLAALTAGVALAESVPADSASTIRGTGAGDALYGTNKANKIYGYGGADLIYGYAGRDTLYGGNERGWGDKILGGSWGDKIRGQRGDDALYGQRGHDNINGGPGNDLIVGGHGRDVLNGGGWLDKIDARDGWRDVIIMCGNERDEVYYDWGLDVLRYCEGQSIAASSSSSEASDGHSSLSTRKPPEDLFEHSGKVLVSHENEKQCVPEKELKNHLEHGDEVINPTGCSDSEKGRR